MLRPPIAYEELTTFDIDNRFDMMYKLTCIGCLFSDKIYVFIFCHFINIMACDDHECKIYDNDNISIPCESVVVPDSPCQGPWFMKARTGENSSNSMVYQVFNEKGVMNILKQIVYDHFNTKARAIKEIDIHVSAANAGLAPTILEIMYNKEGCSIIMTPLNDTMDRTIYNVILDKGDIKIVHHLVDTAIKLLGELHKLGITHNDAHPNNFMLDRTGRMFLIDFGLAARDSNLSKYYDDCQKLISGVLRRFKDNKELQQSLRAEWDKYTRPPKKRIDKIIW